VSRMEAYVEAAVHNEDQVSPSSPLPRRKRNRKNYDKEMDAARRDETKLDTATFPTESKATFVAVSSNTVPNELSVCVCD